MIESDKKAFAEAISEVLKMYNQEAGKIAMRIWWAALQHHDLKTVLNALGEYCADPDKCRFAPKAGDIVGLIEGGKTDRKDAAIIAFARVLENVSRYDSVAFDDPGIHYAIQVGFGGDWIDVCNFDDTKFEYQEKRRAFMTAYASFRNGMSYKPYFCGIHELENADVHVKLIGNEQQARLVMEGGKKSALENVSGNYAAIVNEMGINER